MLTVAQLAESLNGIGHGNAAHAIHRVSSISRATANDITYFNNPSLKQLLVNTKAGVVLLKAEHQPWCPVNSVVVADPLAAIEEVATFICSTPLEFENEVGIHPTAYIHPSAVLPSQVSIGPYVYIGEGVVLAPKVNIGAHSILESAVKVGANSRLGFGVTLHSLTDIGENVVLDSGTVIGETPFNYMKQQGQWRAGPKIGGVIIANDVRIGANTVVDRASIGDTYIDQGVCIDNLVHIGHDTFIGANTAVAGCATIGAHVQIGPDCIIGGASCIGAFVELTDNVVISGMSTVNKSIFKSGVYTSGTLAHDHQRWRRNAARFRRLDDYITRLNAIEKQLTLRDDEL